MELPSKLLEKTVEHFESLPGVGRRTALRYTLHLLKMHKRDSLAFGADISRMVEDLRFCKRCHNISDHELCQICTHPKRDHGVICVVEDLRDLLALESTGQYFGSYHILGGVISPMDGIAPSDLHIDTLLERVRNEDIKIKEVIFALPATMEGDTTCFYLFKKLGEFEVNVTSLARGVAVGNELQYTDEVTLGRSLLGRLPYETAVGS